MTHSTKKRPKSRVVSKMQDKGSYYMIQQPVSRVIKRDRLKMILKNLSLLRLLKSSNPRIQELYTLARSYWNSMLRVPRILQIASGHNTIYKNGTHSKAKLQGTTISKKKLQLKKLESIEAPTGRKSESLRSKVAPKEKAKQSTVMVLQKESEVPRTLKGDSLDTWPTSQEGQAPTVGSQVIFMNTHQHKIPTGDSEQLEADTLMWFEGLPTRVHLPGPRVMCRSSTQRWVKRCCTRFCSASLELPMCHPYRML